jgi:hypothetical protein
MDLPHIPRPALLILELSVCHLFAQREGFFSRCEFLASGFQSVLTVLL